MTQLRVNSVRCRRMPRALQRETPTWCEEFRVRITFFVGNTAYLSMEEGRSLQRTNRSRMTRTAAFANPRALSTLQPIQNETQEGRRYGSH